MNVADVTVIVPTQNEARNITAFLHSLPEAVTLIVVDDSRDETPDLIEWLRPQRTRVLRLAGNIAQARQAGAEAASAPWLLFSDADVSFAPDYFERLTRYSEIDALYGPKLAVDRYFRPYYRRFSLGQKLLHKAGIPAVSGSNCLVSRRAFTEAGGFDPALPCNEDSELGWRLKRLGYRIEFAPDLAVYANDHRRILQGAARKTAHSLIRCALLYLNLMPSRWKRHDWGYWADRRRGLGAEAEARQ